MPSPTMAHTYNTAATSHRHPVLSVSDLPQLTYVCTCYKDKATEAWHRHERHKPWHTQKHQHNNHAAMYMYVCMCMRSGTGLGKVWDRVLKDPVGASACG